MMRVSAEWIESPRTRSVMQILIGAGFQAWFVGGCVRDALLGKPVTDIDIATDARPEQVMSLAQAAGLKTVPTGIDHGTVTVMAEALPHEVTTFRRDVKTDGRRAVVAYSEYIAEDARRRDLTINALYANVEGSVSDPTGQGLEDLNAGRIRFIGDADTRIKEDYLRILRFFRFYAHYGAASEGVDPDGLAAVCANLDGLETLSAERTGAEMRKLLSAPVPTPALSSMAACGVLNAILPGADATYIGPLVHLEAGLDPDPIRRLVALGGGNPVDRLRLSRAEAKTVALLREEIASTATAPELAYRHGAKQAKDIMLLRAAILQQPVSPELETEIQKGVQAVFPISATELIPDLSGPALGSALRQLEAEWITSGFALDRETLLSRHQERKLRDNS